QGPTRSVSAGFLGTPWLWFVVPCMARLSDAQRTSASLLDQPRSSYVLVDYSCPDGAGAWARANHPDMQAVHVPGRVRFRGAEARNAGAAVDGDSSICFLDADTCAADGFAEYVLEHLESECTFLVLTQISGGRVRRRCTANCSRRTYTAERWCSHGASGRT